MAVSCRRRIQALWCSEHESNAWVWLSGAGWRKLDDSHRDACTNLLAIAALAKARNVDVMVREDLATTPGSSPRSTTSRTAGSLPPRRSPSRSANASSAGPPRSFSRAPTSPHASS